MLGSCLGTASLACLFVIISFTREMFFNTDSSKRRGRALVANSTLIEVLFPVILQTVKNVNNIF